MLIIKLGIISDTHISKNFDILQKLLSEHLESIDYIIHAGDYVTKEVIEVLKKHNNFIGVHGNVDNKDVKCLLPEKQIINLQGYNIGIFHGHGETKTTIDRAYEKFKDDLVDIIIFGHSHKPLIKTKNKVLMLNPGSLTSKRTEKWYSYIFLEICSNRINANLCFLEKCKKYY